mgnify:FL=1
MAVTTDPSKTGSSETDALALTGTTLAPNVGNASRNSITPTSGALTVTGSISATGTATLSDAVYFQKELALLNTMAEHATIANRSQIYVDVADGLLKLKDGAGVVKVFDLT